VQDLQFAVIAPVTFAMKKTKQKNKTNKKILIVCAKEEEKNQSIILFLLLFVIVLFLFLLLLLLFLFAACGELLCARQRLEVDGLGLNLDGRNDLGRLDVAGGDERVDLGVLFALLGVQVLLLLAQAAADAKLAVSGSPVGRMHALERAQVRVPIGARALGSRLFGVRHNLVDVGRLMAIVTKMAVLRSKHT